MIEFCCRTTLRTQEVKPPRVQLGRKLAMVAKPPFPSVDAAPSMSIYLNVNLGT